MTQEQCPTPARLFPTTKATRPKSQPWRWLCRANQPAWSTTGVQCRCFLCMFLQDWSLNQTEINTCPPIISKVIPSLLVHPSASKVEGSCAIPSSFIHGQPHPSKDSYAHRSLHSSNVSLLHGYATAHKMYSSFCPNPFHPRQSFLTSPKNNNEELQLPENGPLHTST